MAYRIFCHFEITEKFNNYEKYLKFIVINSNKFREN